MAPQRPAQAQPAANAAFDQLLLDAFTPPTVAAQPGAASDAVPANARPKGKGDGSDPASANAAAAAMTPPAPQLLPAITLAGASGAATVAAPTLPMPALPAMAAAPAASDAAAPGSTDAANAKTPTLPAGAAELEARIAAGAPSYMSQPPATLSGLWHHMGASENAPPNQLASGAANGASAATPDGAATSQTQAASDADAQIQGKDLATLTHAIPAFDAAPAAPAQGKAEAGTGVFADPSATTPLATGATAALPTAAAPPAAALPPAPVQIPPVWDQVAVNLQQAAQTGTERIEIQLKPASLGAIAVKLDVTHDGRITAVISADRSDTLNLLRQGADTLTQSLRDAGLQADTGSLSFNLSGNAQSFAQHQAAPALASSTPDDLSLSAPMRTDPVRYRQHAGAIDIEV